MIIRIGDCCDLEVYTEEDDKCYTCGNVSDCPLIVSLQSEVVIMHYASIVVERCGLYKEMENTCDGRARAL